LNITISAEIIKTDQTTMNLMTVISKLTAVLKNNITEVAIINVALINNKDKIKYNNG